MDRKIKHGGPVRSTWADLHVTKAQATRIWERIQLRHDAFNGNVHEGHTSHAAVNYIDSVTVCTTTQRYCKHGETGYTVKVRGCPIYRALMMAGIITEAGAMDVLPKDGV